MQKLVDPHFIQTQLQFLKSWLFNEVLILSSLGQIVFILIAFMVAYSARQQSKGLINKLTHWRGADDRIAKAGDTLSVLTLPLVWLFIQYISSLVASFAGWRHHILTVTISLLTAWIIIRLTTVLIRDKNWSRVITLGAWIIASLNILNLLDPTMAFLDLSLIHI